MILKKAFLALLQLRLQYLKIGLATVTLCFGLTIRSQDFSFFDKTDFFLKTYVDSGKVDYRSLFGDHDLLDSLVAVIDTISIDTYNEAFQKAFCINAYNLLVIRGVLDHYPILSPMDVSGFFQQKKFRFGGKELTLDKLEFEEIFTRHPDVRLHFVLNCGAESCPTLFSEAFYPEDLEQQLEFSTRMVMDREDYVYVNHEEQKVYVSKIFDWYKEMFDEARGSLRDYINYNRWTTLPREYPLDFMEYDWTLNDGSDKY